MSKKLKVYIAFSIHGTNCFISASQDMTQLALDFCLSSESFKRVASRREDFKPDEVKLMWNELLNKDGSPTRSHIKVLQAFKWLETNGWTIHNRQAFIDKHWKKK